MDTVISALTTMFCFATGMFLTDYIFHLNDRRSEERQERQRLMANVNSRYRSPNDEISKTYEETIKGLEKLREINNERMKLMHDQIMQDIETIKKSIDARQALQATQENS